MDHPIAVYNAVSDLDAHLVCDMLKAGGVDAYTIEDRSQVGTWIGGYLPQIHRAQVWVDRADVGRATPLIEDICAAAERRKNRRVGAADRSGLRGMRQKLDVCGPSKRIGAGLPSLRSLRRRRRRGAVRRLDRSGGRGQRGRRIVTLSKPTVVDARNGKRTAMRICKAATQVRRFITSAASARRSFDSATVRHSATARTIGSVLLGRTRSQRSGQSSRRPSRRSGLASAKCLSKASRAAA